VSIETDFFDTNVILYLLSEDETKADQAEALLASCGTISVLTKMGDLPASKAP